MLSDEEGNPEQSLGNLIFNSTARKAFGEVMVSKLFAETAGRRFSDLLGLRGWVFFEVLDGSQDMRLHSTQDKHWRRFLPRDPSFPRRDKGGARDGSS